MNQQQNEELTRVGAGTAAGTLMRQYWMPAALAEELEQGRPVIPVTLFGERLALYRPADGELALVQRSCAHRGVDLCFGRVEGGGIRCPFHGWHYDANGQCTEQPGEPADSQLYRNVRLTTYPVVEKNGIVWAFMGEGEPPAFPDFDCFVAPDSHVFAFKGLWQCNWLQALEIGIDPVHASFLHRFFEDEDTADSYGKQFRDAAANTDLPQTKILREFHRPEIRVNETEYGMQLVTLRDLENDQMHVRVTNHIFPCAIHIPMSRDMTITQWHVPIDDENTYWYSMFTSYADPVDKVTMRQQRLKEHTLPDYAPIKNRHNDYGYDPQEQRTSTYTGMGSDINVHDQWACESMGAIQDRTAEHLGTTDIGITTFRRQFRKALRQMAKGAGHEGLPLQVDADAAGRITGPVAVDATLPAAQWEDAWESVGHERRRASSWAKSA